MSVNSVQPQETMHTPEVIVQSQELPGKFFLQEIPISIVIKIQQNLSMSGIIVQVRKSRVCISNPSKDQEDDDKVFFWLDLILF